MTDHALFVVAPYVAALVFVLASVVRYTRWRLGPDRDVTTLSGGVRPRLLNAVTCAGVGVGSLRHLVAVALFVRVVTVPIDRLRQRAVTPAAYVLRPAWSAIAGWSTTRVQDARASLLRNEDEEN